MKWLILILAVAGLAAARVKKPSPYPLPPLPSAPLPRQKNLHPVGALATVPARQVVLLCVNREVQGQEAYQTGIEATTNWQDWIVVARAPYQTNVLFTLTNRPPSEYYRAFNAFL